MGSDLVLESMIFQLLWESKYFFLVMNSFVRNLSDKKLCVMYFYYEKVVFIVIGYLLVQDRGVY